MYLSEITVVNVSTMTANPIFSLSERDNGFGKFKTPTASIDENSEPADQLWGEDGFTFGDLIDLINPLQHIPGLVTVYRGLIGDQIAPVSHPLVKANLVEFPTLQNR